MAKVLYLCWVSGTGKTTIVEAYKWKKWLYPISFSGYMKKYALANGIISQPDEIYRLPSAIRATIEGRVWESIEEDKKSLDGIILIDGHLYVESDDGKIRPTFKDEVAEKWYINEIIFIKLTSKDIIKNRSSRAEYRPQSADKEGIEILQTASYERAIILNKTYNINLTIIDNPENDFAKSAAIVASRINLAI